MLNLAKAKLVLGSNLRGEERVLSICLKLPYLKP